MRIKGKMRNVVEVEATMVVGERIHQVLSFDERKKKDGVERGANQHLRKYMPFATLYGDLLELQTKEKKMIRMRGQDKANYYSQWLLRNFKSRKVISTCCS